MSTIIKPQAEPRVWIGCLACYNNGHLVGDWFNATVADEVTVADVHGAQPPQGTHEEIWVFDTDAMPGPAEEMSPQEAAQRAQRLAEVAEDDRDAFAAWWASGDHVEDSVGLPVASDFEERFCGTWGSFRGYAEHLADETGLLNEAPDEVARYFDWAGWIRDLAFDYTTLPAADGGVYVMRSI